MQKLLHCPVGRSHQTHQHKQLEAICRHHQLAEPLLCFTEACKLVVGAVRRTDPGGEVARLGVEGAWISVSLVHAGSYIHFLTGSLPATLLVVNRAAQCRAAQATAGDKIRLWKPQLGPTSLWGHPSPALFLPLPTSPYLKQAYQLSCLPTLGPGAN